MTDVRNDDCYLVTETMCSLNRLEVVANYDRLFDVGEPNMI